MVHRLAVDKVQAVKHLERAGYLEKKIAEQLGISRKVVRAHLGRGGWLEGEEWPKDTTALTGSQASKVHEGNACGEGLEALDAIGCDQQGADGAVADSKPLVQAAKPQSGSECESFRGLILEKLEQGLTAQRIHQDLAAEHGIKAKYHFERRFVAKLSNTTEPPFRRLECEPGAEMQVDFGGGARCKSRDSKLNKTHVFRAVSQGSSWLPDSPFSTAI